MKIGMAGNGPEKTLVLCSGDDWIDLGSALKNEEDAFAADTKSPRDIFDLLRSERLNVAFLSSVLEALDAKGALATYAIESPERFALPYRPGKIVAVGRNYAGHARELGNPVPKEPLFFAKSPTACIGDGEAIRIREDLGRVDYEAELAVVLGKQCTNVSPDEVRARIAGYTLLNDVTARDIQQMDKERGHPWYRSKNLDTFCPLGPVIALPDEIAWPVEVQIELHLNGETRQSDSTSNFIFSIPEMIAYISGFMTLEAGDVVATGTPEGVGPIKAGDTLEIRIPEIGILRNSVTNR